MRVALLWRQLSETVTLYQHDGPRPGDEEAERLAARGITVVPGRVTGLHVLDGRLAGVRLDDDRIVPSEALMVAPVVRTDPRFPSQSGLTISDFEMAGTVLGSFVASDATGATVVAGVWVAGNVRNVFDWVIAAATGGTMAETAINADLVKVETERAVARRAPVVAALAI